MTKLKLSKSEVEKVARLAQLKLSEKEVKKFQRQLSDILSFVSQLEKLNTEKVEPTSQTTGLENIYREDEVRASLTQKQALSGAKKKKNGYFEVKAVF